MDMNKLFMDLYKEKYGAMINRDFADEIVKGFSVTDGSGKTDGEHWNYDDAKNMGDKIGVNWEKVPKCEYYVVLNMMYSDYGKTIKKHALPDTFIGELAYDWFLDDDGGPEKTFNYFIHL